MIQNLDNFEDLINLSKQASSFVVGFEGNVSKKIGQHFLIKASGSKLSNLKKSEIVTYDFELNQIDNKSMKGSMEIGFHSYLLSFDSVNYVCHTHPIQTMKILCSDKIYDFAKKRLFPDQVVFNGINSCVIPYVKPGDELKKIIEFKISNWLNEYANLPKLILLKNHGIITLGKTINECLISTEICEKSAEIFLGSLPYNQSFLTKDEIYDLVNDENEKFRINKL
jgi:ribulose-5-phosphate 4-epimerase/fuculose-1-phosphate aldolase